MDAKPILFTDEYDCFDDDVFGNLDNYEDEERKRNEEYFNSCLKKYDLTYEQVPAFFEKYNKRVESLLERISCPCRHRIAVSNALCDYLDNYEPDEDDYPTNVNIEDCEFINLSFEYDDCFNLGMDSVIRESIFNGVICNNHSLIYGNSDDCKSKDSIVKIHNCEFKNCSTEDGDGIIDGFINIPNIESSIQDCEGLENLDKEGDTTEDYTIRYEDENGDRIGCDMDIDSIMAEFA